MRKMSTQWPQSYTKWQGGFWLTPGDPNPYAKLTEKRSTTAGLRVIAVWKSSSHRIFPCTQ
ncbi:hypothetical protein FAIPA1_40003 [Frankia sp. AiPs1]